MQGVAPNRGVTVDDRDSMHGRKGAEPHRCAVHDPQDDFFRDVFAVVAAITGRRPFSRGDEVGQFAHRGD
jgi:hypothetical protein